MFAKLTHADVVVTHGPEVAEWSGFFLNLFRVRAPHLAWGFTSTSFDDMPRWRRALTRFNLRGVDRFVTFSHRERRVYAELFDLPVERIEMLPFSIGRPPLEEATPALINGEYIAAMGGEGRDYGTLVEAVRALPDVHLVLIARAANLKGLDIPPNVTVKVDIPYADALNIAAHAKLMVIPLRSHDVAGGHLTLISQFHLGIPSIVTRAEVMQGYVIDEENALTCEVGDAEGMRRQIVRLLNNPDLSRKLVANGLRFARTQCAESSTIEYFRDYLRSKGLLVDTAVSITNGHGTPLVGC